MFEKFKPGARLMNYIAPKYRFDVRKGRKLEKWILNWADDPLYNGTTISANNLLRSDQNIKHFYENVADKVKTPFFMVLAGKETLVCNKASRNFFENSALQDKNLI